MYCYLQFLTWQGMCWSNNRWSIVSSFNTSNPSQQSQLTRSRLHVYIAKWLKVKQLEERKWHRQRRIKLLTRLKPKIPLWTECHPTSRLKMPNQDMRQQSAATYTDTCIRTSITTHTQRGKPSRKKTKLNLKPERYLSDRPIKEHSSCLTWQEMR